MARPPGLSVRLRLTLSHAGLVVVAGVLLVAVVWVFLLRYVPDAATNPSATGTPGPPVLFAPGRSDLWEAFAPKAALALGALLALGLLGGWVLAGRLLAPLQRLTEVTRAAGAGALSERVALPGRQDEFRELADAFDGMLARLEDHVAEQQRFAANASHELRTPLAVTQALLDVARRDPHRDTEALLDRLQAVNARAVDLTEALLLLSRDAAGRGARARVDLSLLVEEAAETLLPLAEELGVDLAVGGEPVDVPGSPVLLAQLVANLVHNGVVHNLPAGGTVQVVTSREAGAAVLTVASTGAELAPELVATLVEPFRRGAERVRTHTSGVGLGLAIVQRITTAHGGTLALAPRPGGGLVVSVRLPPAQPAATDSSRTVSGVSSRPGAPSASSTTGQVADAVSARVRLEPPNCHDAP